ncbi:MAG TPA: nucleoside phosphorylase [Jiangellales bacterium]|nr:nucleoside phosphorylase [Jiangellales bacterium]
MTMSRVRLGADEVLPLTRVRVGDLAPRVLVVGDPGRVEKAAARLTEPRQVGANREYVTYTGTFEGTPVSVASHGVGSAGAAVCFEELCRGGAERIIRAGTAGGLQPDVLDGSLVVATAAVREEGLTRQLVPLSYPAVADADLVVALRTLAGSANLAVRTGVVLTSDCFYPLPVLDVDHGLWQRAGCVAVEMEMAALLVVAAQHGVAAGGILAIDGNPLAQQDLDMSGYQPFRAVVDRAVEAALDIGLRALVA